MKNSSYLAGFCTLLVTSHMVWADPPKRASSDLPLPNPGIQLPIINGTGASASSSGSASSNGGNGQVQSRSSAQVQTGSLTPSTNAPSQNKRVSSDPDTAAQPSVTRRATVANSNGSGDQIITGADDDLSTVIKIKSNGQITMVMVNLNTLEVRRVQANNAAELAKKDRIAAAQFEKYNRPE